MRKTLLPEPDSICWTGLELRLTQHKTPAFFSQQTGFCGLSPWFAGVVGLQQLKLDSASFTKYDSQWYIQVSELDCGQWE